jgi:hypothetical protein
MDEVAAPEVAAPSSTVAAGAEDTLLSSTVAASFMGLLEQAVSITASKMVPIRPLFIITLLSFEAVCDYRRTLH